MVSAQEPALIRIYKGFTNGNKRLIMQGRVEQLAPGGGAPDGLPASVATPDQLLTIDSNVELNNDDILFITVELDGSDGLDASDSIWNIPLVTSQGPKMLGRQQFQNPTFADVTPPLNRELFIAGYRVVEGSVRLSGKIFLDVQDDTA